MHSTSNSENSIFRNRYGLMAAVFSLALAVFVFAGVVSASGVAATTSKPVAQATTATPPNDTVEVPNAAPSGVIPAPIDTTSPTTSGTAVPGQSATGGNSGSATNTTSSSNSFPWLLLVLLVVIVALLIIAFVLLRGRRSTPATATVAAAPAVTAPPATAAVMGTAPADTTATSTTTTTTAASAPPTPAVAPAAAAAATSPAAAGPEAAAAGTALPTTLTCPNCSTVNDWSENFCHECGQDLRPLRASMIAAAAPPPDIVTDDMPYLETLDRTDEQLEYVLSRKKIVVGTAPGNDIVIDSAFKGSDTVSPRHAELRREGDGFMLVDLDSENGTYVNDARTGENLLAEGDQIRFGSVRFVYRVPEPSA